ncbi:MAG: hypothetical protein EPO20_10740 [Betaproteobacteria bacterium]|nr:MAG: hypothetical protein EPO20_10740 [Betaproteobacteria bacterium]
MILYLTLLVFGLGILAAGGEALVRGATGLARSLEVSGEAAQGAHAASRHVATSPTSRSET